MRPETDQAVGVAQVPLPLLQVSNNTGPRPLPFGPKVKVPAPVTPCCSPPKASGRPENQAALRVQSAWNWMLSPGPNDGTLNFKPPPTPQPQMSCVTGALPRLDA